MKEIYFTIAGANHRHGSEFMEKGMPVSLVKEPDNEYDSEAIKVMMPGLGQVGYVANSANTVLGESMSAGRIYDKIGDKAAGQVLYVLPRGVICHLDEESIISWEAFTDADEDEDAEYEEYDNVEDNGEGDISF